jgi:S1-C subfamily serine protease
VIDGASSASVTLANGDIYDDVTVLDSDKRRDLVLLKIKALNVPISPLGDSDTLEVGQHVIAIGNPEGLARSVSDGIISAFRQAEGFRVIQTTAPISHGSSGGPLLSDNGQVLGITYAALDGQNLNLAVPINYVKPMLLEVDRHPARTLAVYNAGRLKTAAVADSTSQPERKTTGPSCSRPASVSVERWNAMLGNEQEAACRAATTAPPPQASKSGASTATAIADDFRSLCDFALVRETEQDHVRH